MRWDAPTLKVLGKEYRKPKAPTPAEGGLSNIIQRAKGVSNQFPTMHYFGPGPAALPKIVTEQAAQAVLEYGNTGISILSLAHRSPEMAAIMEEANSLVNTLCDLRDEYHILWLPGGGRMQFAMVPMNLLHSGKTGLYIDSGYWSHEAIEAAKTIGEVSVLASSRENGYRSLPDLNLNPGAFEGGISGNQPPDSACPTRQTDTESKPKAPTQSIQHSPTVPHTCGASNARSAYLHQTTNNTIFGTQFLDPLPALPAPLVADMSSDILGVPRDFRKYALFYAVAQKNLGPAGVTLVCIRKDFLPEMADNLPPFLSYKAHVAAGGVLNTLPVFNIYTCLLMLRWMAAQGLENIFDTNARKAEMLYAALDESPNFVAPVKESSRSRMNVVFRGQSPEMEKAFLDFCAARNISGIEGHRSAGSFRASIYNGVSEEAVEALVRAIRDFDGTFAP